MPDAAGTVYKFALEGSYVGVPVVNIHWFQAKDDLHDGEQLFTDWMANLLTSWRNCNLVPTTLDQITVSTFTMETPSVPAPQVLDTGLPAAGVLGPGVTGALDPPAVLAQHAIVRTALAGRSFRGRLYFGPSLLTDTGDGWTSDGLRWGVNSVSRFTTYLNTMLARYIDTALQPWKWVIWSRVRGGNLHITSSGRHVWVNKPPFHAAGATPVVSATAYAGIRTQRRREAPRGT